MSYDLGNTDSITYDGKDVDKLTLDGTTIWERVAAPKSGTSAVPSNASGTFIGGVESSTPLIDRDNLVKVNEISLTGIAQFDVQSRITIEFFSWFMDDLGRDANFDDYSSGYVNAKMVSRVFNKAKNSNTWVGVVQDWNTDAGGIIPGPWSYQIDDDDWTNPARGDGKWGGISDVANHYERQTDSINHIMLTSGDPAYNALAGKTVGSTALQSLEGANEVHLFYGGWTDDDSEARAPYGVSFLKESNDKLSIWAGALDAPGWGGMQGIFNGMSIDGTTRGMGKSHPRTEWVNAGYLKYPSGVRGTNAAQMKFPLKDWKVTAEIIAV